MQAGTRFTYPGGMEGRVDLVYLIARRPGVKLATSRSRVQRSTNATTKTTNKGKGQTLVIVHLNKFNQFGDSDVAIDRRHTDGKINEVIDVVRHGSISQRRQP